MAVGVGFAFLNKVASRTFVGGRLPLVGAFPVRISGRTRPDWSDPRELAEIATPLAGRRVVPVLAVFPLLSVAATFGPAVVAAFEVENSRNNPYDTAGCDLMKIVGTPG